MDTHSFFEKYTKTLYSMMQIELADRNKAVPNLVIDDSDSCKTSETTIYLGKRFAQVVTQNNSLSEAELYAIYMGALGHEIQHIRSTPMPYYQANINQISNHLKTKYPNFPNPDKFAASLTNMLEDARINRIRIYNSYTFSQYSALIFINLMQKYDPTDKITGMESTDFQKIIAGVYYLALCGELPQNYIMPDCIPDYYATEIPNILAKCVATRKCKTLGANAILLIDEIMKYAQSAVDKENDMLQQMFNNYDSRLDEYQNPDHNLCNTTAGDFGNQDEKQSEQSLDDELDGQTPDSSQSNNQQSQSQQSQNQQSQNGLSQQNQNNNSSQQNNQQNQTGSNSSQQNNQQNQANAPTNNQNQNNNSASGAGKSNTTPTIENAQKQFPRIQNDLSKYPLGNPVIKKTPNLQNNLNNIIHDINGRINSSFDNTATKIVYDNDRIVTPKALSLNRKINFTETKRNYNLDSPLPVDLADKGKRFKKKVRKFFEQQSYILNNQKAGRINKHQLADVVHGKTNIFLQQDGEDVPKMCAYFLIDNSGSMRGRNQKYAFDTMAIIEEGFKEYIPLKIVAYSDYDNTTHHVVKGWTESQRNNCCFNFRTHCHPAGGTPTEDSVEIATAELMARPEEKKLLFVVTDGEPNDISLTRNAIALARKKGIMVFPVMIGRDLSMQAAQQFHQIFGRSTICNPEQIDEVLFGEINKKMLTMSK